MLGQSRSLLDFLDAAVLVTDLEGCAVYANPAFKNCFDVRTNGITGKRLTEIFQGGAREAVLGAVARACAQSGRVRFLIRQGESGYEATASPILSEGQHVGVLLLFDEEVETKEQLLDLQRKLSTAMATLQGVADDLKKIDEPHLDQIVGNTERVSDVLKFVSNELRRFAGLGDRDQGAAMDPAAIVREAAETVAEDAELAHVQVDVKIVGDLQPIEGDGDLLCAALVELLLDRFSKLPPKAWLSLIAKNAGVGSNTVLRIGLLEEYPDHFVPEGEAQTPLAVQDAVSALGGRIRVALAPLGGRETVLSFPTNPPAH